MGSTLYIAYYDGVNADLKVAKSTDRGTIWPAASKKAVDSAGDVGGWGRNALAVQSNNLVHVGYFDGTNGDLKLAKSVDGGATW